MNFTCLNVHDQASLIKHHQRRNDDSLIHSQLHKLWCQVRSNDESDIVNDAHVYVIAQQLYAHMRMYMHVCTLVTDLETWENSQV